MIGNRYDYKIFINFFVCNGFCVIINSIIKVSGWLRLIICNVQVYKISAYFFYILKIDDFKM